MDLELFPAPAPLLGKVGPYHTAHALYLQGMDVIFRPMEISPERVRCGRDAFYLDKVSVLSFLSNNVYFSPGLPIIPGKDRETLIFQEGTGYRLPLLAFFPCMHSELLADKQTS